MKTRGFVLLIHVLVELWLVADCSKFTINELLNSIYPKKTSNDVDLDPCKAGNFMGDIAVPGVEYSDKNENHRRAYSEKVEKYKKEINEGLQIEEEGIIQGMNKAIDVAQIKIRHRHNNRTRKNHQSLRKNGVQKYKTAVDNFLSRNIVHSRRRRAATARKERVWDFGVIPYVIDSNFGGPHKALFKQAMRHWENFTCIKFVERNPNEHPNFILFTERPCGCCSFVGKRGNGPQAISIGKNCDKFGIVVHELGHVVGFWHEHTRPDRDNHVQIVRDHIIVGQEYNFNKLTDEEVNSLGLPYDYDSIMHYAKNTFSKGSYLETIHPIDAVRNSKKRPEIGQRVRLSEGDIAQTKLLYKCYRCGKTLQENTGIFGYSPEPGQEYGERCEWRITATHGERIVLNITELDVLKSDQCSTDFLEIRDGYWHKSPLLGRFCGSSRIPNPIVTGNSRMLISFMISDKGTKYQGFTASYEAVCGGEIMVTDEPGHLESPNFPDDYLPNKECVWKLTAPEGYQVGLKFTVFEIENHDNCFYDYVEIRNGHSADSPLISKYCGYKLPLDVHSTTNKLYVKFLSDSSVQKAGFSATFMKEYDECTSVDHGCEQFCINTLGGYDCACKVGFELHSDNKHCEDACGGIIEATNGTITSPSFPDLYPGNKSCVWEIIAPTQFKITLNFTHFDLEGNNAECEYDRVEVYSRIGSDKLRKHGMYCGQEAPSMITSEANSLRVEFESDSSVHKTGFAAVFFIDMDECAVNNGGCQHECKNTPGSYECTCNNGFTLHENKHDCKEGGCKHEISAPHGEISSPNYPDSYPGRKDCVWHFTTTPGHRIKVLFDTFEMEPHQECAYDHITFYDGPTPDSQTLGRFCGSKTPHPIVSSSNQLYLAFKSDASVQRKGFSATHSTVCGGRLIATNNVKHFYSHSNYGDLNYDSDATCEWTIEAKANMNVHLTFLTFELEEEKDCMYDYVEVWSGLDTSGPFFGKFCGPTNPTDVISMNDALLLRFKTDSTIVSKGFSASYVAVESTSSSVEYSSQIDEDYISLAVLKSKDKDKDKNKKKKSPGKTKIKTDNDEYNDQDNGDDDDNAEEDIPGAKSPRYRDPSTTDD